ncbi:hypothetical protein JXA88_14555 [Candidatus Fermentibacteria bacterium]|nr:hypothetical protein [Candidatus Fermentibacteria bacterium]
MAGAILGWVLIALAAAIPGLAAFLFGWDRIALSKQYMWLGIAAVLLWSGLNSLRRRME